jgi:hypothetical protein
MSIPDKATFIETRTQMKLIAWGDDSEPETSEITQESEILFRKRNGGFVVSVKPKPIKNWEPVGSGAAGLAATLSGMKLQYEFDASGNLVKMRGLDKMTSELQSALPPEMKPMFDTLIPALAAQFRDQWGSRYGFLVGATFRIGYTRTSEVPIVLLPGLSPIPASIEVGVSKRVRHAGLDCVEFFMGYMIENPEGYGETVSRMLKDWLRQMITAFGESASSPAYQEFEREFPTMTVKNLVNTVERIVDPDTMTVYQELFTKGLNIESNEGDSMQWAEVTLMEYEQVK